MNKINEIIGNYISDNELIPASVFSQIIKLQSEIDNSSEFVKDIIVNENCDTKYSYQKRELSFNPFGSRNYLIKKTQTLTKLLTKKERKTNKVINPNSFNILNLFYLKHEINHAIQFKDVCSINSYSVLENGSFFEAYIFLISLDTLTRVEVDYKLNNEYYECFHNHFYSEYNANIMSFMYTLSLLNSLGIESINKIIKKFNMLIAHDLLNLYKNIKNDKYISSPVQNFIDLKKHMIDELGVDNIDQDYLETSKEFQDIISKYANKDQFERLKLGFSINNEIINHLSDISNGKIKTLNLFDDIRNINKF